ncbi:nucleotide exchange factor GrpE [Nostoc sp. UHCC 0702]|nr:nucleotide exchange factor GrpE [Nostoc sp. UHCC 0702]
MQEDSESIQKFSKPISEEMNAFKEELFNSISEEIKAFKEELFNSISEEMKAFKEEFSKPISEEMKAFKEELAEEMKAFKEELAEEIKPLKKTSIQLKSFNEHLNEFNGELINLRKTSQSLIDNLQDNVELREKIMDWAKSSIEIFELFERTINLTNINEDYLKATNKFLDEFSVRSSHVGLDRIVPDRGSDFDEYLYLEVAPEVDNELSPDVEEGKIVICKKWGYKLEGKVLKKAKVVVAKSLMTENQKNVINLSQKLSSTIDDYLTPSSIEGDGS